MKEDLERRNFLRKTFVATASAVTLPYASLSKNLKNQFKKNNQSMNPIKNIKPLGFQWETADPFLFCVHHEDDFPKGNGKMGPDKQYLKGRSMGDDFIIKDGFRMYHGKEVPGFPGHPHRGFETITVVRKGIVDHADSLGAAGRYGNGDVQWMTAGKGVQHSEMFPLIYDEKENPMELFQIWLNLPKKNKMVEPHFTMFWKDSIPKHEVKDKNGKKILVEVIAGKLEDKKAPSPPPNSWANDPKNEVAVWNIKMDPGAEWVLPKTKDSSIYRTIYYYEGEGLSIFDKVIPKYNAVELHSDKETIIKAGNNETSILLLQGRQINEPVIQYGPFVMNTKDEIRQAFDEYHRTQFGGWPWPRYDQVHPKDKKRFALHADGKEEVKNSL